MARHDRNMVDRAVKPQINQLINQSVPQNQCRKRTVKNNLHVNKNVNVQWCHFQNIIIKYKVI